MNSTTDIRAVNSLSYADVAGLSLGLPRLPGEETPAYIDRLYRATASRRDHSYQGALDEIGLQLGLAQEVGIRLTCTDPGTDVLVSTGLLSLHNNNDFITLPLLVMDEDNYWRWLMLSEVVADINAFGGYTAELVGSDGPALKLARQGNVFTVINEPLFGQEHMFLHSGVIGDTIRFNKPVGGWAATPESLVVTDPPAGIAVSYQYRVNPLEMVTSEVGLLGLFDSSVAEAAEGPNGVLAYQLREYIQTIMKTDRSYWGK